jgi:hypothetical protein
MNWFILLREIRPMAAESVPAGLSFSGTALAPSLDVYSENPSGNKSQ